jgi:hypothetical protein
MAYTPITIKHSTANSTPTSLNVAEPAYSYTSNTLFIGTAGSDGAIAIGGQYYIAQQQVIFNSVNAAFSAANSAATGGASLYANTAFVAANSAGVYANAAFAAANNSSDSWVRTQANSAFGQANAAFAKANTNNLTVSLIDTVGNISNVVSNVTTLRFDSDSGFDVNSLSQGIVKVGMNSTFKYWKVNGVTYLTAEGIDTVNFITANGISITANGNTVPQSIQFDGSIIFDKANGAFLQANTPSYTANSAASYANSAFLQANTPSYVANSASSYANASFLQANTPNYTANSAANYANAAFANANTKFNSSGGTISGDVTVTGNIIPSASVTYNLGSPTNRWKDLYLSGNTLNLGNAQIKTDATTGGLLLIPTPTANVPNPTALFISSNGALTTVQTTGGEVTAANLEQAGANTANSVPVDAKLNRAYDQANSSFEKANSAGSYANSAFIRANNSINANTGGTINADLVIAGNLTVTGNTTYANTQTVLISDNIITLNAAISQSGQPIVDAGIEIDRGAQPNAQFIWVESAGKWSANNGNGSIYIGAESDGVYANAAFAAANASAGTDVTQNTNISNAGTYANAAFLQANTPSYVANSAASYANAAFTAANNAGGTVVANTVTLGTPTDGSLSNVGAYTGWTTATKVTDAIDDLNEMMDNVRANTFVKSVTFSASPAAAGSGSTITLTLAPVTANGTIRYDIDWGDTTFSNNVTGISQTHVYTVQGSKTITVRAFNAFGAGTGSEASNTSAGIVVIYTADPTMGYSFYRQLSGGTALVAGSTMYVTEGETFYLQNDTTNTTGSAVTYIANFGDNVANTTIASDTSAGGVFGARLPYSYAFTKSSGTGANTINLVLTSSNTANPSSIPRSIATVSMKIYDANIATPNGLGTGKTITFANTVGTSPLLAAQFANNIGGATTYTVGTSVNRTTATAGNTSTVTLTTIAYNANSGTLTANFNNSNSGARGLTSGSDVASYNSLTIDSKKDYQLYDATGTATTFALSIYAPSTFAGFTATATKASSAVPVGVNNFQLLHSANGNTNIVEFVKDDLTTVPTTTAGSLETVTAGTYRYISGIPYFNSGSPTVKLSGATIVNWIGQTYTSCSAPVLVTVGTNAESTTALAITPTTFTYSGVDNGANTYLSSSFPKANTGVNGVPYTLGDLTVSVANSVRTIQQIGIRANNVNGLGALTQNTTTKLAVHSTAQSGISEIAIAANSTLGATYTDSAVRSSWFKSNTSNTPIYTTSTNFYSTQIYSEASDPGVAGTKEATIRLGVLKYDITDYSTGYLPAGPNRSGDAGVQYLTFAFRRQSVSNFDINLTAPNGVLGVWVAMPGSRIDSVNSGTGPTSGLNGWLDCSTAKLSGTPGSVTASGGNGSDGCALLVGDKILSNTALSGGYTMSFGGANSSETTYNVILVRVALVAGQTVTYLGVGAAA